MGNFHPNVFKENTGLTVERGARLSVRVAEKKEAMVLSSAVVSTAGQGLSSVDTILLGLTVKRHREESHRRATRKAVGIEDTLRGAGAEGPEKRGAGKDVDE